MNFEQAADQKHVGVPFKRKLENPEKTGDADTSVQHLPPRPANP